MEVEQPCILRFYKNGTCFLLADFGGVAFFILEGFLVDLEAEFGIQGRRVLRSSNVDLPWLEGAFQ